MSRDPKNRPPSALIPRPNNKPIYIDCCPSCRGEIKLYDLVVDPNMPEDKVWHDEFYCAKCKLIVFDFSPEELAEFKRQENEYYSSVFKKTQDFLQKPENQEKVRKLQETVIELQKELGIEIPGLTSLPQKPKSSVDDKLLNINLFGTSNSKDIN